MAAPAAANGADSQGRGRVVANLSQVFAALYPERAQSPDAVRFVKPGSGPTDERVVDCASDFLCSLDSPVLKTMLASTFQESSTRVIELSPGFVECWPDVVRFFYGIRSELLDLPGCVALMRVADYYSIEHLKQQCSHVVLATPLSCAEAVVVLRDLPFDPFLVAYASAVLEDHPETLFDSDFWKVADTKVVQDFLSRRLKCSEKCIFDAALKWYEDPRNTGSDESAKAADGSRKGGGDGDAEGAAGSKAIGDEDQRTCAAAGAAVTEGGELQALAEAAESPRKAAGDEEEARPGEQKQPRSESRILPPWLRKPILFEHMAPSELSTCRPHVPVAEYADYLEIVAKAHEATRPQRRSGECAASWSRSRRCKRCGKDDPKGEVKDNTCDRVHPQKAVMKGTRVVKHYYRDVWFHPCCQQEEGTPGCTTLKHDWENF